MLCRSARIWPWLLALVCLPVLPAGCAWPGAQPLGADAGAGSPPGPQAARVLGAGPPELDAPSARAWSFDSPDLPPWLGGDDPAGVLAVRAGEWSVQSSRQLHGGRLVGAPGFRVQSVPLLDGRVLVERWVADAPEPAARGLVLRARAGSAGQWIELSAWPTPARSGWELLHGTRRHGRITWESPDRDPHGRALQRRHTLSDVSGASWRLDEQVSHDRGTSWRLQWVREALRLGAAGSTGSGTPLTNGPPTHGPPTHGPPTNTPSPGLGAPVAPDEALLLQPFGAPVAPVDAALAELTPLLGSWSGSVRRRVDGARWVTAPCRWEARAWAGGALVLALYEERASAAGPGLRRLSLWLHLAGDGRRADGQAWEAFRIDDRSGRAFAFSGGFGGPGQFVHAGRHGQPLARLSWQRDPARPDEMGWIEATPKPDGAGWIARVRVRLKRR